MALDALAFPVRRGATDLAVTTVLTAVALFLMSFAPRLIGTVVVVVVGAMLCAYMLGIASATASGSDESPGWPDLGRTDLRWAVGTVALAFAVTHGPMMLHWFFVIGLDGDPWRNGVHWVLYGLAAFYYPMALLAVAFSNNPNSALPHVVLPSIARCAGDYVPVVLLWVGLGLVAGPVQSVIRVVPLLGPLLAIAVWVYLLTVDMRLLGLLYRRNEEKLGWF